MFKKVIRGNTANIGKKNVSITQVGIKKPHLSVSR